MDRPRMLRLLRIAFSVVDGIVAWPGSSSDCYAGFCRNLGPSRPLCYSVRQCHFFGNNLAIRERA